MQYAVPHDYITQYVLMSGLPVLAVEQLKWEVKIMPPEDQ